jgi:AraC-like DNA-binding protein
MAGRLDTRRNRPLRGVKKIVNITSVIQYIEKHLNEKLDLDDVAKAVHYSKYHLHRLFSNTVGLTVHDYIQRRQLTEAAKLLVFSDKPILRIALLSGYESQQSFTAVFKAMYKQSPRQYRENEVFYPLQLEYKFESRTDMQAGRFTADDIRFAGEADIPDWMELVRLVIDGFPCLREDEHIEALQKAIGKKQALIMKEGALTAGIMMISYDTGSIDFLGVHPLYRKQGIARLFLGKAMDELLKNREISITTFREGDRADTGYRKALKELGFAEAELLTEFGYPTQKFVLPIKGQRAETEDQTRSHG